MVSVDIVIIFSIKDPKQFVYRMGAAYFDQLLSAACEEGIRMLVRNCYASSVDKAAKTAAEVAVMGQDGEEGMPKKMDSTKNLDEEEENMPDENRQSVITLKGTRAEKLFTLLNDKFDGCGVHFSDCKVTGVWLPDELSQSLESVTEMRKKFEKQIKGHDFEMMKIQQESEMTLEEIRRKNEQIVVTENGKKKRAEIEREQRVVKSEEQRKVACIEAEQQASKNLILGIAGAGTLASGAFIIPNLTRLGIKIASGGQDAGYETYANSKKGKGRGKAKPVFKEKSFGEKLFTTVFARGANKDI